MHCTIEIKTQLTVVGDKRYIMRIDEFRSALSSVYYLFAAYRPGFQCTTPYFDNISLSNDSSYVLYENCQIKVFHNDTDGPKLDSVRECTSDYKYTLDKEKTIVTEVNINK